MKEPRLYQIAAHRKVVASYKAGNRAVLLVSPTGSGKSFMMARVAVGHVTKGGGRRFNIYAHRRELVAQMADTVRALGVEVGANGEGAGAPVQVLSVQGVLARGEIPDATMAGFDECHHHGGVTEDWGRIWEAHKAIPILGATATPERGDGRALTGFDDLVVAAQPRQLIELGHLTPVEVIRPRHKLPKNRIAQTPVDAYVEHGLGRRNVVFAPHVKAAEDFALQFQKRGIRAEVVTGKTPAEVRDRTLAAIGTGALKVVINVMVLTEGWDCPEVAVVTLARDMGSAGMLMQTCGRGMRTAPGKRICTVLDLRGVTWDPDLGSPDDDRIFSLDGVGIQRAGVIGLRRCATCGDPLEEGSSVCARCGREAPEQVTPEATGEKLDRFAFKKAEDGAARVDQLVRWMRKFPGKRDGFYAHRFRAVYGSVPGPELIAVARMSSGRRS